MLAKILKILAALLSLLAGAVVLLKIRERQKQKHYVSLARPGGAIEARYSAMGSCSVSSAVFPAEGKNSGRHEVFYPAGLQASGKAWPLVILVNGTGVKASAYREVFRHLASWGFIVAGNEDENTRSGASAEETLCFLLRQNEDPHSIFFQHIDTERIGIAGHSQGGVGAVHAVTEQPHGRLFRALFTASMTSPFWGRPETLGTDWHYEPEKIRIPILMTAGTGPFEAGRSDDPQAAEGQGICPLWGMRQVYAQIPAGVPKAMARLTGRDHGDMLRAADGYMTAWFACWLQDDDYAAGAFRGTAPELAGNPHWQDVTMETEMEDIG